MTTFIQYLGEQSKPQDAQLTALYRQLSLENMADFQDRDLIAKIRNEIRKIEDAQGITDKPRPSPKPVVELPKENTENLKRGWANPFKVSILIPSRFRWNEEYETKIAKLVSSKVPFVSFSVIATSRDLINPGRFAFEKLSEQYPKEAWFESRWSRYRPKNYIADYKSWWKETSSMVKEFEPNAVIVIADKNSEEDKPFLGFVDNILRKYKIPQVKYISLTS